MHLKNIFSEREVVADSVIKESLITAADGKKYRTQLYKRVDASKPNMGLMTWDDARRGKKLTKQDVEIATNYLQHEEIKDLELLVSQYLDFAERQARQRKVMYMADWKVKLDAFLQLNEVQILTHAGKISAELAKELAVSEYGKFEDFRKKEIVMQSEEELSEALRNLLDSRESVKSSEE